MAKLKVLVACEFSGVVREAFAKRGHDAWSCDLLPTEIPGNHIQGDVLEILNDGWDLMIAHPPCTYLANSGVRWLWENSFLCKVNQVRWDLMKEAREFAHKLLNANVLRMCVENPIPHKYAQFPRYSQIIQPWMFGHGETKATCLWLKNLPLLKPTNVVDGREARIHRMPPSKDRNKERSRTFRGIAEAMAEQWSEV